MVAGQRPPLAQAVRDRRQVAWHGALEGLLAGTPRFAWPRPGAGDAGDVPDEAASWEGPIGDDAVA